MRFVYIILLPRSFFGLWLFVVKRIKPRFRGLASPRINFKNVFPFQAKSKKPLRPPGAKLQKTGQKGNSLEDVVSSSSNSSREKLNGSSDRLTGGGNKNSFKSSPLVKKDRQPTSLPIVPPITGVSPKKHSFGKSTPPPKPKPPAVMTASKNKPGLLCKNCAFCC
jgi:hypothetical protein